MLQEAITRAWGMPRALVSLWAKQSCRGLAAEAKCCPKLLSWVSCSKLGAMPASLHVLGKKEGVCSCAVFPVTAPFLGCLRHL